MIDPLFHPTTRRNVDRVMHSDQHAYGLIGPSGAGKKFVAKWMAYKLLQAESKRHNLLTIQPEKQTISIEQVRQIGSFLRLKSTASGEVKRAIIIEDADTMTIEAQNALLKSLEEPPGDTKIILTIQTMTSLKPTIYSRIQAIHIRPCALADIKQYAGNNSEDFSEQQFTQAYLISFGYCGLCFSLLRNTNSSLLESIEKAKKFLSLHKYERLIMVSEIAKDSQQARQLLFALKKVLSAAIKSTTRKDTAQLASHLRNVHRAEEALKSNPNLKLLFTNLALSI